MSYIHQANTLQAMKRLYMLGNRPYRGSKSSGEAVGAALGGIQDIKSSQDNSQKKQIMEQAIRQQTDYNNKQNLMARAIQQQTMQQAIESAKAQQAQNRMNDAAVGSRIGGSFTGSGFEQHAGQTDKKQWDLNQSQQLLRGSMFLPNGDR